MMTIDGPILRAALRTLRRFPVLTYGFISALALAIDFAAMVAAKEWGGAHYLLAASVGLVFGTLVHYRLAKSHVFDASRIRSQTLEFAAYASIGLFAMLVSLVVIYVSTDVFGLDYRIAKAPAAIASFVFGYLARKHLLFESKTPVCAATR